MQDVCFNGGSLTLLGLIGGLLQTVIVTLFFLAIRSKDDSIRDARELRDRALDINEQAITAGHDTAEVARRALPPPRGRR